MASRVSEYDAGQVPDNEQGELQGSLASLLGLATIIAPPLMTGCFSYFSSSKAGRLYFPGIPYLLAAFLTLVSLMILLRIGNRAGGLRSD